MTTWVTYNYIIIYYNSDYNVLLTTMRIITHYDPCKVNVREWPTITVRSVMILDIISHYKMPHIVLCMPDAWFKIWYFSLCNLKNKRIWFPDSTKCDPASQKNRICLTWTCWCPSFKMSVFLNLQRLNSVTFQTY